MLCRAVSCRAMMCYAATRAGYGGVLCEGGLKQIVLGGKAVTANNSALFPGGWDYYNVSVNPKTFRAKSDFLNLEW